MSLLSIKVLYNDDSLIELEARATNNRYSGVTTFCINADGKNFIDFGSKIKGFPKSVDQVVEVEFGYTEEYQGKFQKLKKNNLQVKPATAFLGLKFYCIDHAGHPAVQVTLQEDNWSEYLASNGNASFEIRFEPAQIDKFAEEIMEIGKNKEGSATLVGITDRLNMFVYEKTDS